MDCEDAAERDLDQTQKGSEPGEKQAEVVTRCGEDCVGGVAVSALEIAAPEMSLVLHVADDGLDGRSTPQLAFDGAEDTTSLSGDEDAARVGGIVAAIALVDIGSLDLTACEPFGALDDGSQVWPS